MKTKILEPLMDPPGTIKTKLDKTYVWPWTYLDKREDCRPVKENIRTCIPLIAAGTQHLDHRDEYSPV